MSFILIEDLTGETVDEDIKAKYKVGVGEVMWVI